MRGRWDEARAWVAAAVVGVVGVVVACGADGSATSSSSSATTRSTWTPTSASSVTAAPPSSDPGVSEEEARDIGAVTADHDATVTGPRPGRGGRAAYTVRNVGRRADTYTLAVAPAGRAEPATLSLGPGEAATVDVTWGGAARLDVVSAGRAASLATIELRPD